MRKINLKGISEILSEKELKNVMGGSGSDSCNNFCTSSDDCPSTCKRCLPISNWAGSSMCVR